MLVQLTMILHICISQTLAKTANVVFRPDSISLLKNIYRIFLTKKEEIKYWFTTIRYKGNFMNIVLLQGGFSPERDISLKSGEAISKALKLLGHDTHIIDPACYYIIEDLIVAIRENNPDLVFMGLHGAEGEDGTTQAILKGMNLNFTGSDNHGSAIAINKYLSASIAKANGLLIPRQMIIREIPKNISAIIDYIKFPMVVKPNSAGSSVGVYIVDNEEALTTAIRDASTIDKHILIQQYIKGRELTVSILGHDTLPIVEIKPYIGFYDYENKYTIGKTEYICPAKLNEKEMEYVKQIAIKVFFESGCSVYGRVDFIFDEKDFYFLEINTLPGMREESLLPIAAKEAGLDYISLIEKIIKISMG